MKLVLCLLTLALLATLPAAADVNVTGNWTGTFTAIGPNGETHDSSALLILKQDGTAITGSVGPDENERYEITKGAIDGNKLTLDVAAGDHTMHFVLTLAEDRLQGEANAQDAEGEHRAKLDVKRAK